MTNEAMRPGEREPQVLPTTDYGQTMERLFVLAATHGDSVEPCYYRVAWDADDLTGPQRVTVMTVVPTGARRQELGRLFHQAQFVLSETASDGTTSERILWCNTGPRRAGTPIEPQVAALAQEYDYVQLSPENIVETLAVHARTVDDFLTLVSTVHRNGMTSVPELARAVNRLIHQFAYGVIPRLEKSGGRTNQDKIFELLTTLQSFEPRVLQGLQRYMVNRLLRRIVETLRISEDAPAADTAALVLENALEKGVLPSRGQSIERILSTGPVYRYPFATDLLHDRLRSGDYRTSAKKIFSVDRLNFVHDYIVAVARCGDVKPAPNITAYLRTKRPYVQGQGASDQLYELLNDLLRLSDPRLASGHMSKGMTLEELTVRKPGDVTKAFAHILWAIHEKGRTPTVRQRQLDRKSREIIDAVLAPVITGRVSKRVGNQALRGVASSLDAPKDIEN